MYRVSTDNAIANLSREVAAMAAAVKDLSNNVAAALLNGKSSSFERSGPVGPSHNHEARRKLLPQLDRNDYKDVKQWDKTVYKQLRKSGEGAKLEGCEDNADLEPVTSKKHPRKPKGESPITSSFMELPTGKTATNDEQDAVRARARQFFNLFLTSGRPIPPSSKKVDVRVMDDFIAMMEENFFFLRLCSNHWKSEQVFQTYYPTWHDTYVKKPMAEQKAKKLLGEKNGEVIDVDADSGSEDQGGPSKRPRLDNGTPSPPPHPTPIQVTTKRARVRVPAFIDHVHS